MELESIHLYLTLNTTIIIFPISFLNFVLRC